eukprot:2919430-Prymnesium_polylepis.1
MVGRTAARSRRRHRPTPRGRRRLPWWPRRIGSWLAFERAVWLPASHANGPCRIARGIQPRRRGGQSASHAASSSAAQESCQRDRPPRLPQAALALTNAGVDRTEQRGAA